MPKIGLLAFTAAAIAVAGVSYAADKIMLACSDLVTDEVYSFVIDLDRKIVSTRSARTFPSPLLQTARFGSHLMTLN